jgi:hypothetical protein
MTSPNSLILPKNPPQPQVPNQKLLAANKQVAELILLSLKSQLSSHSTYTSYAKAS